MLQIEQANTHHPKRRCSFLNTSRRRSRGEVRGNYTPESAPVGPHIYGRPGAIPTIKLARNMGGRCVYDCIHPWWGGRGVCVYESAGEDDPAVCSCDAGYALRDAIGHPSCVPKRVLVAAYLILTVASVLATVLLGYDIAHYHHLPTRWRSSRKTATRMRALVASR